MAEPIHLTTAIFYCNGTPHVGSAYEALAADVFARCQRRRRGRAQVSFLSGTDEHGDKIRRAAIAEGLTPKAYTDKMSVLFRDAFAGLNIDLDYWVRTTDAVHEKFVQQMLLATRAQGNIEFKEYEGLYCVGCERFYTEKELLPGNLCPTHNTPVELIRESNYFLKIDRFREQVRDLIKRDQLLIRPERYKNEALNMLAEPLSDLCISRPKARMDWGIELPFDGNYVTYVWYDAFWAYVSEPASRLGLDEFMRDRWPHTEHFIGKDILKTHAVYWPAILMAAGLPLFRSLNVHGWLNFGGSRMSKSSGNVRDPVTYEQAFGPDVLRYFVMREVVYGLDGDFSEERLTDRYNADLANDLGNFTSRVLAMAQRYFNGEITQVPKLESAADATDLIGTAAHKLSACFGVDGAALDRKVIAAVDNLDFKGALETIWQTLDAANKYIVATAPFSLAKDPEKMPQVAQILANLLEALRVIADALEPFMPVTARKIFAMLKVDDATARLPYGEGLKPGHQVNPPVALFPRREKPAAA
ncbi:MAG: methionine--tRNA ligase [Candidatus Binataceae bacterium]|nr:methionine--tRNA ligase [Candidatus Binataceae bacterium]